MLGIAGRCARRHAVRCVVHSQVSPRDRYFLPWQ
jgi:hypothetical protein